MALKVIKHHLCSYLSLLFMKRTKWVKCRVLCPLSWAEHNCNTFTGITFMIELWRTKLHSSIITTTSLFSSSSKSLMVLSSFQQEPCGSSVTKWKYIGVCHGNFYIPSEKESEELAGTSLNTQDVRILSTMKKINSIPTHPTEGIQGTQTGNRLKNRMPGIFSHLFHPSVLLNEFYVQVPFPLQPILPSQESAQEPDTWNTYFLLLFKKYFCSP